MKIEKRHYCNIEKPYAIQLIHWQGEEYCVAASENRDGDTVLIHTASGMVHNILGLNGGVMSIIEEEEGVLLAIERFYPIFQSKKARIVRFTLPQSGNPSLPKVEPVADLPYVHRILTLQFQNQKNIIAGTLCTNKEFEQDWSSPGTIYILPCNADTPQSSLPLSIHKHHGMWHYNKNGTILVSGTEGIYEIGQTGEEWTAKRWLVNEVSDMCLFDLDGDSVDEMVTIEKFHGDELCFYRQNNGEWQKFYTEPVAFCHAIWAGKIGGVPCVLGANRGDEKELLLFVCNFGPNNQFSLTRYVVDTAVGTTNFAVRQQGKDTTVFASNHGSAEIASYSLHL
ncbi:MAG: hypothetical protein ACK5JF_13845 [Oscillospiraceae bacterium]